MKTFLYKAPSKPRLDALYAIQTKKKRGNDWDFPTYHILPMHMATDFAMCIANHLNEPVRLTQPDDYKQNLNLIPGIYIDPSTNKFI